MEFPSNNLSQSEELAQYNFDDFSDRLRFLHRQLALPDLSLENQSRIYLDAGCQMFNAMSGFLVFSMGAIYRKVVLLDVQSCSISSRLSDTAEEIYQRVTEQDQVSRGLAVKRDSMKPSSVSRDRPDMVGYVGIPLRVANKKVGVLCFSSLTAFELSSFDIETLELMAEGVARMIELDTAKIKSQQEDRGFAVPGVKSLDEYIHQATIPEVYGVSGRVIDVLQRRIGGMPLSIDHISEELKLSKRTLQRRLQQQNVSFAQLRDQVRYHHAINYLVRHTLSIDSISTALDFSDRTSFTNAFKRWTALSPSTFRKLFRDYA